MEVGVLFGAYASAILAGTWPLGRLADRIGRRKPFLWGLVGLAATTVLFAFASSYPLLLLARVLQGLAAAATWTSGLALLAEGFPSERRGQAMATAFAAANIGVLLGPPISGFLMESFGPRSPFLLAAGLALADAAARVGFLRDAEPPPGARVGLSGLLANATVRTFAGAMALGASLWAILESTLPLHLDATLGMRASEIGILFAAAALTHTLTSPLMGRLSDRVGRLRVLQGRLRPGGAPGSRSGVPLDKVGGRPLDGGPRRHRLVRHEPRQPRPRRRRRGDGEPLLRQRLLPRERGLRGRHDGRPPRRQRPRRGRRPARRPRRDGSRLRALPRAAREAETARRAVRPPLHSPRREARPPAADDRRRGGSRRRRDGLGDAHGGAGADGPDRDVHPRPRHGVRGRDASGPHPREAASLLGGERGVRLPDAPPLPRLRLQPEGLRARRRARQQGRRSSTPSASPSSASPASGTPSRRDSRPSPRR